MGWPGVISLALYTVALVALLQWPVSQSRVRRAERAPVVNEQHGAMDTSAWREKGHRQAVQSDCQPEVGTWLQHHVA